METESVDKKYSELKAEMIADYFDGLYKKHKQQFDDMVPLMKKMEVDSDFLQIPFFLDGQCQSIRWNKKEQRFDLIEIIEFVDREVKIYHVNIP